MNLLNFMRDALNQPSDYIGYHVSTKLAELYPDMAIITGSTADFEIERYAEAGHCALIRETDVLEVEQTEWMGREEKMLTSSDHGWFRVPWQSELLELVLLTYQQDCVRSRRHWIIADTKEIAERFFASVCEWSCDVHEEILVYEGGRFRESKELFKAIASSEFDSLILPTDLKRQIQADLAGFFESAATYQRYHIPWKRGMLLIGPPGNGKTHAIKALINQLKKPCLYVKSLTAPYTSRAACIKDVFDRARRIAPCIVVLEDLDSLIDAKSRSFFLNELDGFTPNTGVAVVATTNHPKQLDPAILNRPSRFDRKFYFELPKRPLRAEFLERWSGSLQEELQVSAAGLKRVAKATRGFSFAYMKELGVSAMMQWMAAPGAGKMDKIMLNQAEVLRTQMAGASLDQSPECDD